MINKAKQIEKMLMLEGWIGIESYGKYNYILKKSNYFIKGGNNYMVFNMPLSVAKKIVNDLDIQYIIDEDNNYGFIQDLFSLNYLNHPIPSYTIKLSEKTEYENHSMQDNVAIVNGLINNIYSGRLNIEEMLLQINKYLLLFLQSI